VTLGKRCRRSRTDALLVFDPAQTVPDSVLKAITEEWLVPRLVEQFLREHGSMQPPPSTPLSAARLGFGRLSVPIRRHSNISYLPYPAGIFGNHGLSSFATKCLLEGS
jgi:hypothetical protein